MALQKNVVFISFLELGFLYQRLESHTVERTNMPIQ